MRKVYIRLVADLVVNVDEDVDVGTEVMGNLWPELTSDEADVDDFTVVSYEITDSK